MKRKPYRRKPGEFELRVLKDGRLVLIAPDEGLIEIGRVVEGPGEPETTASGREDAEPPGRTD